jgi:excisionase family DNA binding protein
MTRDTMTVQEAAEALAMTPATVRAWIRQGRLPAVRVGPRELRIPRTAVVEFIGRPTPAPMPAPSPESLDAAIATLADTLRELHQPWSPGASRTDAIQYMLAVVTAAVDVARAAGHDVGEGGA